MKKVYLFLAAVVAALSSCMQEGALVPVEQENKVTIKAVAGDTKTLLDGTSVVWEQEDQLAVLLKGEETTIVNFAVEGEVDGANATFTGTIAPELEYTAAYAVYPASAYTVDGGVGKISHTLPETQTGVITSGMNLSSALLNVEQLQAGEAVGTFQNALTLLQVVVPAGVQSVSLHSSDDALVGALTFNEPNADGVLTRAGSGTKRTVTLSTGSELAQGTHSLLVYPGIAHTLTLTMVGTDGAEYTSAVSEIRFNAGEYRTIDLTEIFNVATDEVRVVLPAGGTVEVPVVTTGADYQVSLSSGAESWLTYELPTKSFHKETIVFTVAKNDTGADREATVTITCGEKSKTFTIKQKNIFVDFLNDENGDPIQWEETFGVYKNEADANAGTNAVSTYKNIFTIELSDDFSKGTYLVKNIFKAASYSDNNGQPVTNKGGQFYANYEAGKLTLLRANSVNCYGFTSDVVILYNEENNTFSAEPLNGYDYSTYRSCYIGGYTAAVKVEEPETPGDDSDPIAGTWTLTAGEMGTGTGFGDAPTSLVGKTMVISGSGGNYTIDTIDGKTYSLKGTFDGNILSALKNGVTLKFVYDSESKTLTQEGEFMNWSDPAIRNIVATKQGGGAVNPLEAFVGTWSESFNNEYWMGSGQYNNERNITVSISEDKLLFENMFVISYGGGSYYGTLSNDGKILTLEDASPSGHKGFGPLSYSPTNPILLNVSEGNLIGSDAKPFGYLQNYVATKN